MYIVVSRHRSNDWPPYVGPVGETAQDAIEGWTRLIVDNLAEDFGHDVAEHERQHNMMNDVRAQLYSAFEFTRVIGFDGEEEITLCEIPDDVPF